MGSRGRKSAADLATVPIEPRIRRPGPPDDLTEPQAELWRAVVARMPPDWFTRETHEIFAAYCRHAVRYRLLSHALDQCPEEKLLDVDGLSHYDKTAKAAERESRAMLACARSLRITHQSQYDAGKAARETRRTPKGPPPWESWQQTDHEKDR